MGGRWPRGHPLLRCSCLSGQVPGVVEDLRVGSVVGDHCAVMVTPGTEPLTRTGDPAETGVGEEVGVQTSAAGERPAEGKFTDVRGTEGNLRAGVLPAGGGRAEASHVCGSRKCHRDVAARCPGRFTAFERITRAEVRTRISDC